jgi:hypothetical protein
MKSIYISLIVLSFSLNLSAQFDITNQYKIGEICDSKYTEFGLGIWHDKEDGAYFLKYKDKFQGHNLLAFTSKKDCNTKDCNYQIALFIVKNNRMEHRYETELRCVDRPYFEIVEDHFILVSDKKAEWAKIEANPKAKNIEDNVNALVFVIAHEKLNALTDLNLSQLKISRNLIFAKHGYTFASHALDFHFREQSWYKPLPENQKDTVFTAKEVFLIKTIQCVEKTH